MTQKELLYLEDAIGHEGNIITILEDTIKNLQNKDLKTFLKKELKKHESLEQKLMSTMEVKANE